MAMLYGFDPTANAELNLQNVLRLILVTELPP